MVKIAGVETEFFLTIDDSGILRATVSKKCSLLCAIALREPKHLVQALCKVFVPLVIFGVVVNLK